MAGTLKFVRWSSAKHPGRAKGKEGGRNHSKWHLVHHGSRVTFCGRAVNKSVAAVKPEYGDVQLIPLAVSGKDVGNGICRKCARSVALIPFLRGDE